MADRKISSDLLTLVLYGAPDGMHYTQDTPVMRDVWLGYAGRTGEPQDILMVPWGEYRASSLASLLHRHVGLYRVDVRHPAGADRAPAEMADMPGVVAAKLHFDELCNVVLPATDWWRTSNVAGFLTLDPAAQENLIFEWTASIRDGLHAVLPDGHPGALIEDLSTPLPQLADKAAPPDADPPIIDDASCRMAVLMGLIASTKRRLAVPDDIDPRRTAEGWTRLFANHPKPDDLPADYWPDVDADGRSDKNLIYMISANRPVRSSVANSVPTTKADAAGRVFRIDCSRISWAVLDSGIDARHEAFLIPEDGKARETWKSRVKETYDFALFRRVRSRDVLLIAQRREALADELVSATGIVRDTALALLEALARDADEGREADFAKIRKLLALTNPAPPESQHGTHVAGILGGAPLDHAGQTYQGMCPDITLYDFRVLSGTPHDTEFAVIGALRMIYHINTVNNYRTIHGANLSLSLPHDVMNYACGRTPVCLECEMLVKNGVVVVAAAGNQGYHEFTTSKGPVPLYAATSITDPGNAELVITVGSTHRIEPHTYGVSYFSSRGPTGDGRMKPDLVAPGEKIRAAIPRSRGQSAPMARKGGTSMAAPHVSGAAAMLMGRFPEFIGQPDRIKQILCSTATDLGRDRTHQGAGLLDILRALQSV